METVITTNELRVATINGPAAYFEARDDERGFEYDLVRAFADELGVNLALTVVDSRAAALAAVADRKVHLAAANLPVKNSDDIAYGYSYLLADYQLIYKRGTRR
ncbi:MAG: transporter substrate-binding domain-containing protein, partial [Gammaproteobacteria bacterium]|nr:transporter substrate-binding domain-containing protein [Gammaproteobacteria bacterium]